jgi:pimeloyl-ACP methyl ester carboxylesterase
MSLPTAAPAPARSAAESDDVVRTSEYPAGPYRLSAVEAGPPDGGRGIVVALHGSGYTGQYWDARPGGGTGSGNSLLRLGARLGYRVVALDRPGYGRTAELADGAAASLDSQAALLSAALAAVRSTADGVPIFVMGHSLGSLIAVRLAVGEAAGLISALDLVALPVAWRPELRAIVAANADAFRVGLRDAELRARLFFGPPHTYDAAMLAPRFSHRVPRLETTESLASAELLAGLAPRVRVPVQCTVAEFDQVLVAEPTTADQNAALFSSSPRAVGRWQPDSGHNVSLHRVGRAYHLRAFAFFDEVTASTECGVVAEA